MITSINKGTAPESDQRGAEDTAFHPFIKATSPLDRPAEVLETEERTPFQVGSGRLWVDPTSWDVRFGGAVRQKTVLADLAPDSTLWASGSTYRISSPGRATSLAFQLRHGLAESVREVRQEPWVGMVLTLIPRAGSGYAGPWSRVGIRKGSKTHDFSMPSNAYFIAADGLRRNGLTIVRVRVVRDQVIRTVTSDACA